MADTDTANHVRGSYEEIAVDLARAARSATTKAESMIYHGYRDVVPDQFTYEHAGKILHIAAHMLQRAAECLAQAPAEPVEAKGDEAEAAS